MGIERFSEITAWRDWRVDQDANGKDILLGEGAFGKVYQVVLEEAEIISRSAMKVISISEDDEEIKMIRMENQSEDGIKQYLDEIMNGYKNEIKHMISLKSHPNIVNIEDFKVLKKTETAGWDIFIRMELLTSLNDYRSGKQFNKLPETEAIKLGKHILSALESCSQLEARILHRDIKPANIFISPHGFFKLGDFGIARELRQTARSLSQRRGTELYMAPEVFRSNQYDGTADIYSLGLVLYQLLNNNRLPFVDPEAQFVKTVDRENALRQRLSGEPMPAPAEASEAMAQAVLKACAFNPCDRYQTPAEFQNALEAVSLGSVASPPVPISVEDYDKTVKARPPRPETAIVESAEHINAEELPESLTADKPSLPLKNRGKAIIIVACAAAALWLFTFVPAELLSGGGQPPASPPTLSPSPAPTSAPTPTPTSTPTSTPAPTQKPMLGIVVTEIDEQMRENLSLPSSGMYVEDIVLGSGAEDAGLQSGDVIVAFGDDSIDTIEDLLEAIGTHQVGDIVDITLYRNGVRTIIPVRLGATD